MSVTSSSSTDPVVPVQRELVHVRLPVDTLRRLRAIAAVEGESWSAIMRRILRRGLDQDEQQLRSQR